MPSGHRHGALIFALSFALFSSAALSNKRNRLKRQQDCSDGGVRITSLCYEEPQCNGAVVKRCGPACLCTGTLSHRDSSSGRCVTKAGCGILRSCGSNEAYHSAGTCSPESSCLGQPKTRCGPACVCRPNHYRNQNEECVPSAQCSQDLFVVAPQPQIIDPPPVLSVRCPAGQKWFEHGFCTEERQCDGLIAVKCGPGCFCMNPWLRERDGRCKALANCGIPTVPVATSGDPFVINPGPVTVPLSSRTAYQCFNDEQFYGSGECVYEVQCNGEVMVRCPPGCFCPQHLSRQRNNCVLPSRCAPPVVAWSNQNAFITQSIAYCPLGSRLYLKNQCIFEARCEGGEVAKCGPACLCETGYMRDGGTERCEAPQLCSVKGEDRRNMHC